MALGGPLGAPSHAGHVLHLISAPREKHCFWGDHRGGCLCLAQRGHPGLGRPSSGPVVRQAHAGKKGHGAGMSRG